MRIEQNASSFPTSFGEARVRGLGLTGDLREEQVLHNFLSASPDDTHLAGYLDALNQVGITSFTPPMTFGDIQGGANREGGGHLILDLPLQQQDADGNKFTYILVRVYHGITHYEFPVDPASPRHPASALRMMAAAAERNPGPGLTRFIVPFDVPPTVAGRVAFAVAPLATPLNQGIIHILRVKLSGLLDDAAQKAAELIAEWADSKLNPNPGMKWFKPGFPMMTPSDIQSISGKRTLLFVHGIISSIDGAFSGLFGSPTLVPYLTTKYGPYVIGYDHYTLSKTHLQTAIDLVGTLPAGANLDIVCHSRGAAVIRAMLEYPSVVSQLQAKNITVNTVIFVAGANAGTPIAEFDNLKTFVNVIQYIADLIPGPVGVVAYAISALLKIAVDLASELDSLNMLSPTSAFYQTLQGVASSQAQKYLFARADYDLSQFSSALAFLLSQVMNVPNDLVIPWDSAGQFYAQPQAGAPVAIEQFEPGPTSQTVVYHTDFFTQSRMWTALNNNL